MIKFLEEYLGSREIVQNIMLKSLAGFSKLNGRANAQTNLNNIKDVIAYLRSIGITEKQIKSMIFGNFEGFVQATRRKLEVRRQLLMQEETVGITFESDEINKMIEENMYGFLRADLRKVKEMVAYLRSIGFEDETIKDMAIRNLQGLSADPEALRSKKASLTKAETIGLTFTSDEINKMIAESIQSFLRADLQKVKLMVAYLRNKDTGLGFKDDIIKDMAIRNLKGLSADPEALRSKKASLTKAETIGLTFTSDEINKMIAESIQNFLRADLQKVKEMVAYLRNKDTGLGFKDEIIKDMAIRNLLGLSADPETLRSKRELLMQEETIGIAFASDEINKMIAESIQGFLRANLHKVKEMVTYLQSIGFKDETIKEMAIRNLLGLCLSADPETLRSKRELLMQEETIGIAFTSDEINKMIEGSIQRFLRANLHKVKEMVTYLQSIGFKDETIKEMAIRNLLGLSVDPETLRNKKASLTKAETIGIAFTSDEINKMIEKSIEGFLQADLQKVKKMVAYLRNKDTGLGFKDETIKAMAISNLRGLAADPEILRLKRASLTKAETIGITFIFDEINKMIEKSIEGFLQVDLQKVKEMVAYLRSIGFEDETIKDMAIRNLQGLSFDPERLRSKKELLMQEETIGLVFTSAEINKMIKESIQSFLQADFRKVKEMVAYLRNKDTGLGFKDDIIKDMAISNLKGLAADPETLRSKRELLMQEETIGIAFAADEINQMIEKDIGGFLVADLQKVKKMVRYLKDIGFEDVQIKNMAIRNFIIFSTIESYELRNMMESFKREQQLRRVEEKALMEKIREMMINQGLTDFFYHSFDANLNSLKCAYALSN